MNKQGRALSNLDNRIELLNSIRFNGKTNRSLTQVETSPKYQDRRERGETANFGDRADLDDTDDAPNFGANASDDSPYGSYGAKKSLTPLEDHATPVIGRSMEGQRPSVQIDLVDK
jgi:hypothetical protein